MEPINKIEKIYPKYDYFSTDSYISDIEYAHYLVQLELEKKSLIASMGEIVISTIDKPIIGTTALDTCYGIVLYDRKNKKGIVGHAAPSSKIYTLREMINLLDRDKPLEIEYAIVPGYRNIERKDYRGLDELLECLFHACPPNIKLKKFATDLGISVPSDLLCYQFAFNVTTGKSVTNELFYEKESSRNKYR